MGRRALLIIGLLLLVVVALAGYWASSPETRPAWLAERLPGGAATEVELYRWQDENGQWILSGEPPPAGTNYEMVRYRSDTNVLPTVREDD